MAAMMGMPPATAASKAIERPSCRARSNSSGPCSASRALLAVTTSLPLSSSFSMIVRAGSSPPTNSTAATISGLSSTWARSAVSSPAAGRQFRGRFRSGSTTWTNSSRFPACRAMRSACSSNSRATPEPIVPNPMTATFDGIHSTQPSADGSEASRR